ncbi:MAG: isochorismatase family protein [Candidatus Peribacteria bacterium]|jgi:nicotinamidase-related amidase|nr:isochorismatase family protein [Candidatus Peribacteria bacterium]
MKNLILEICNTPQDIAVVSVDNTQTFEDKRLNELYVPEGEQVAQATKQLINLCKPYGIMIINVLEEHPRGHLSLATSYKNKHPYDVLTYDEVKQWTSYQNGISDKATFDVREVQRFLAEVQQQVLRPNHSLVGTEGIQLMPPLQESDFNVKILKGQEADREAYSGFDRTVLDETLRKQKKKILLIGGVAIDYCVGQTALDAKDLGYEPYLIQEAIRGVALQTTQAILKEFDRRHIDIITLSELATLLSKKFTQ